MRIKSFIQLVILTCVIAAGFTNRIFGADLVIVFVNVNVVTMESERILPNQTVVIRNGIIAKIGDAGKIKNPTGAVIINGQGRYLMPGLVDSHVHLYSTTEMPLYIANGVTTVFDLNGSLATLGWKKKIANGQIIFAPTIFATGPKFDVVRTPDEAVREVEAQYSAGFDGIKIYPQVSKAEFPALIAAAKKRGMIIVGHIARRVGLEMTLREGQSIAHVEEYLYTFFNFSKSDNLFDEDIKLDENRIPQAVEMTRASGVSVIATLVTYDSIVQQATDLENYLKKPELKYIAPYLQEKLIAPNNVYYNGFSPEEKKTLAANLEFQKKIVKALYDAKVPIVAGTDSLGVGPVAGFSLHEELRNFTALGLSPFQALQTATTNAAALLKSADKFGTVTVGKRADLLLIDGNPLADIANVSRLTGVMARGRWFPKSELNQKLEDLPAAYLREEEMLLGLYRLKPVAAVRYLSENDPFGQIGTTVLKDIALRQGTAKLIKTLREIRSISRNSPLVREVTINRLGYTLLNLKKTPEAIKVFQLGIEFYPQSANVYDSLGEAFMKNGMKQEAIKSYRRSLELNPNNGNAVKTLKKLEM